MVRPLEGGREAGGTGRRDLLHLDVLPGPPSGTGGDSSGEGIDPHANPEVQALQQEASQHCMNLAVSYSQRQDNPCERAHWVAEIRHVRWHMPVWGYRLA